MARRDALFAARRRAIEEHGSARAGEALHWVMGGTASPFADPPTAELVATVARRPIALTEEHLAAARAAGHDDEGLFELVCAAATGEGLRRRERAMRALRGDGA